MLESQTLISEQNMDTIGKKNVLKMAIAALSLQFLASANGFISPALQGLVEFYADIPSTTVLLLASLPSLLAIPTSIAAGLVAGKTLSFRSLALISTAFVAIAGAAPFLLRDNFTIVLVSRCVYGLAYGIVVAIMSSVIIRLFEGKLQATLLGFGSVVLALGGVLMPMLSGILADIDVHFMWLVHLVAFVSFVLCLFWLPEPAKVGEPEEMTEKGGRISGAGWGFIIMYGLSTLAMYSVMLGVSIVIIGEGIGTAATSGMMISVYFVGGFIGGLLYAKYLKLIGKYFMTIGALISGFGMLMTAIGSSVPAMYIGFFLVGVAFTGWMVPGTYSGIGMTVSPNKVAMAGGLASAATNIGGFLASNMIPVASNITGYDSPRAAFFFGAIIYVIIAIYFLINKPPVALSKE
jgi:MFS family permease